MSESFRLLTRSDFDGLVCATLLKDLDLIDEVRFVHPKDVQDGKIDIQADDILANLPYVAGCHLCFDHHSSEELRLAESQRENHVLEADADSTARVLYNYYGGAEKFPQISSEMLEAVDKADSARFTREEVLDPQGWALLSFTMDARTGLGRFHEFSVSNYQLMMDLIEYCKDHTIDEILALPDVNERVALYRSHREPFEEQLRRCATVHGSLVEIDLRSEETIYVGNRFLVYSLFPECNISMHVLWGREKQNTVFTIGKSIFDRSSEVDVGALALKYGGGGHEAAGTCQVSHANADRVREELIEAISAFETAPA